MSSILNEFGQAYVYRRPARAAENNTSARAYEAVEMKDIGALVPSYDRKTVLSASRKLYLNEEILKGAIEQKSMYAVGKAWSPLYQGANKEWGAIASRWLEEEWYQLCDFRGTDYDFQTILYTTSNAIDRDGEGWEILTEDRTGYPRVQQVPAHRVGNTHLQEGAFIKDGPYRNAKVVDGIAYNRLGQPVAIGIISDDKQSTEFVSYRNVVHNFDPAWQEQGRGLPAFLPSINALRDMLQSHEWERHALLMLSSIGLIEKNEIGGPDTNDPSMILTGGANAQVETCPGVQVQNISGGMIRYFRSNTGSGLETMTHDRPSGAWQDFHDRIIRAALAGVNWPYSMVWKNSGQGTAERSAIGMAQRSVEDRQTVLKKGAKRKVGYAIAKAMKLGILPPDPDWWKWDFTMPQKLTIDDGRVSKELIEGWKAGYINQTDILGAYGKDLKTHLYERAEEIAMRKVIAAEVGAKHRVEIEEREMAMLTPNDMGGKESEVEPPTRQEDAD